MANVAEALGVSPADLEGHARHIEAVADEVAGAGAAGAAVRAGGDAYGQLCGMVPMMLGALQDVLVDAIGAVGEGLRETGGELSRTAREYEASDERSGRQLGRIQGEL